MKWTLCDWDGEPAVHRPGHAKVYRDQHWKSANSADVGHNAHVLSEAEFKKRFGKLKLPPED